jgi:phenylacetic acid degradation operon negative regulatory protein
LKADPPRAKSLIVTVWGDALAPHGGAVWLAGLIRLMAPFAISCEIPKVTPP